MEVGWPKESHFMVGDCRGQTSTQGVKAEGGSWDLLRGRNFQSLTLVKHKAGGLLRQRAGQLELEREQRPATCQKYHEGQENEPDGLQCPFPTLRGCAFRRPAPEKPRTQAKMIHARSHTFTRYIM